MSKNLDGKYLVDAESDPLIIKVIGRASYLNCRPLADFFEKALAQKKHNFGIDLGECTSMDSTFIGIITSLAMRLVQHNALESVRLYHVSERNLELIHNMGLDRIFTIEKGDLPPRSAFEDEKPLLSHKWEAANPELVLKAHQALVAANEANKRKFEDLMTLLERELEHNNS